MTKTIVKHVADFALTGAGENPAWGRAEWLPLTKVNGMSEYSSKAKVLYSDTGIYFHVDNEDKQLTCSALNDFDNLYTEDVVEVFLWTEEAHPVYFEYEISPLDAELPILISNSGSRFHGWLPWHFEGARRTRHATWIRGGEKQPMAAVQGWQTEFFFPFALFAGLENVPPAPGATWRANIYRIDYDSGQAAQWAWCPDTGSNFHAYRQFGVFEFER